MATPAMQVRTEGRMLFKKTGDKRLADAGKMPIDQLEALIAEIKSGKAPKAAKAADPNGAKKKTTATAAVAEAASPAKAKKTSAAPVAEPAPKAAKSKTTMRGTAVPKPAPVGKGRNANAAAKRAAEARAKASPKPQDKAENERWHKASKQLRATEAKIAKAAKATPKAEQPKKAAPVQGIARLDNASIDWTRESPVGTTGKRKQVLDLLRKFEGDKRQTLAKLAPKATEFYPDKDEAAARKMLTWLIGRVAFDFASKSGQHVSGSRTWTPRKAVPTPKAKKAATPVSLPAVVRTGGPARKATRAPKKASKRA